MVDVISKRCDHPAGCMKQPSFGMPGSKAGIRCTAHKEPGMVNLVSRHCDHPEGCMKQPSFGLPGATTATRCTIHKDFCMEKVKRKRQK